MSIQLIQYNQEHYYTVEGHHPDAVLHILKNAPKNTVNWLDVSIKERGLVEKLAAHFQLHDLVVEDIFNHNHLPKYELYENYCFLSFKMLSIVKSPDGTEYVQDEQIGMVLGSNWVLTVQEVEGDVFDEIRKRIAHSLGNVRKRQADYLFYRLLDVTVDHYFLVLEYLRTEIEALEEKMTEKPETTSNEDILHLKNQLRTLRRFMLPLKNEVNRVRVEPSPLIQKQTIAYFNDIYDHLLNLETSFETFREMLGDLMDLHFAHLSNNMNKIMKTLTTVSTIFIPLTFVAGIYGMNFKYMPELEYEVAYPILLSTMLVLAMGLVFFMRRKGWF